MQSSKFFPAGMDTLNSQHSSSTASSPTLPTTRAQGRGSRTTNACEACKKRKTKCSGPRGPCEACRKVETFCHFNARLDTRRKLAYKPAAVQEKQQYILHALFQTLKSSKNDEILKLINMIRSEALPQDIASCLRRNILSLQDRGVLPPLNVDETDLVSLGLQGLFSHRAGRPGLKQSSNRSPNDRKVTLKGLEELVPRPECLIEADLFTASSSSTRRGSRMENHGAFPAFTNEPSLISRPAPLDSISLPTEDTSHSSNASPSLPSLSSSSPTEDATKGDIDQANMSLYHSHFLSSAGQSMQTFPDNYTTASVAPQSIHRTAWASSGQVDNHNLQSALPDDNHFMGHADDYAETLPVTCTAEQLNDMQRAEYEFNVRHRMPHYQWNIPTWACEASATQSY